MDDIKTLDSLADLGALLLKQGKAREATIPLSQAYQGYKRLKGPSDVSTLTVVNRLAIAHTSCGQPGDAQALYEEVHPTQGSRSLTPPKMALLPP